MVARIVAEVVRLTHSDCKNPATLRCHSRVIRTRRDSKLHRGQTPVAHPLVHARGLRARGQLVADEQLLNQRRENGVVHRCELHQTRVQTLKLCPRHGVEIHTRSGLGRADSLQPTKQNLGSAGI
jgi:hypothetical protein